jgi:metal-responsive CopG/Arc/MetJ family transcriptional regulator
MKAKEKTIQVTVMLKPSTVKEIDVLSRYLYQTRSSCMRYIVENYVESICKDQECKLWLKKECGGVLTLEGEKEAIRIRRRK